MIQDISSCGTKAARWPFVGDLTCLGPSGTSVCFLDFSGVSGTDKMSYVLLLQLLDQGFGRRNSNMVAMRYSEAFFILKMCAALEFLSLV